MNKGFFKSKTLWGFGIAALIALGRIAGVAFTSADLAKALEIASGFFGVYGLRDAIK